MAHEKNCVNWVAGALPDRPIAICLGEDTESVSSHGNAWMALDVISIVISWPAFGDIRKSQYWTARFGDGNGRQRRITTKETDRKKAQRLADEYEKVSRTKRSLRQAQAVLDRAKRPTSI